MGANEETAPSSPTEVSRRGESREADSPSPTNLRQGAESREFDPTIAALEEYVKPHECPVCGKILQSVSNLNRHQETHSQGTRKFKCSHPGCRYTARQRSNLKAHQLTHMASRRRYSCDTCSKSYSREYALRQHQKTHDPHHEDFKCQIDGCSYTTGTRESYSKHVAANHQHEPSCDPLACPIDGCSYKSAKKENLRKHVSRQHKDRSASTPTLEQQLDEVLPMLLAEDHARHLLPPLQTVSPSLFKRDPADQSLPERKACDRSTQTCPQNEPAADSICKEEQETYSNVGTQTNCDPVEQNWQGRHERKVERDSFEEGVENTATAPDCPLKYASAISPMRNFLGRLIAGDIPEGWQGSSAESTLVSWMTTMGFPTNQK